MVRIYVGITDWNWFRFLRDRSPIEEVNFWQPRSGTTFQALQGGELFVFKLGAPRNLIAGFGIFFRAEMLPVSVAWDAFAEKNGHPSLEDMKRQISSHRRGLDSRDDFQIGCRILTQPEFWSEELWRPVPPSIERSYGPGKSFSTDETEGRYLWDLVQGNTRSFSQGLADTPRARYGEPLLVKPRLGQGAFRVAVTDAYNRRCVVTGERTLPVLEAAHIRPFAQGGEHEITNGLLFRKDIHTLFDRGYVTVNQSGKFEVSARIKSEYENGRHYYEMHGTMISPPRNPSLKPTQSFLAWHNEKIFRG